MNTSSACFHIMSLLFPCSVLSMLFLGSQCTRFSAVSEHFAGFLRVCTSKFCPVVCRLLLRWQTSFLLLSKPFHCWMRNVVYGKLVQLKSKVLPRGKFSRCKSVIKYVLLQWVNLQITVKLVLNGVNMVVQGSAHLIINSYDTMSLFLLGLCCFI